MGLFLPFLLIEGSLGSKDLRKIDEAPLGSFPDRRAGPLEAIVTDEEREAHRLAFDRWLDQQRAESVFQGGLVALDTQLPSTAYVRVAVTPADFVFVNEGGPRDEGMPELGRFARTAVKNVDVVDTGDNHVPEPATESLDEPDALAKVVVDWQPNGGGVDRDEFAFRSAWAAWEAAHRFRRFALPPLLS